MTFACEQARKWCKRAASDGRLFGKKNDYHISDLNWMWMDGETPYPWHRIVEHFDNVFKEA